MLLEFILIKILRMVVKHFAGGFMEKVISKIVERVLKQISPQMRQVVIEAVDRLEAAAESTKNPWDDLAVIILKVALGMD